MVRTTILAAAALAAAGLSLQIPSAYGDHSWGNYHWQRSANPKSIDLGDNLGTNWDPYLATASEDWNVDHPDYEKVIDTEIVPGTSNRRCRPTAGMIEVCSRKYGNNGWLGLAQIWASGTHITKGIAKLNDTYFDTNKYNKPEWRNLVMCQEVAHAFGLDHQDEGFYNANLGSCMDYTNKPLGPPSNEHPNAHDYEQLASIYAHLDAASQTITMKSAKGFEFAKGVADDFERDWGRAVAFTSKGQPRLFVKDLGASNKRITHVFWTEDAPPRRH